MENTAVWYAYIIAALLTLLCKLLRFVANRKKYAQTVGGSVRQWFFETTAENAASWLATVLVVWVVGFLFIERAVALEGFAGKVFETLPVSMPTAAAIGFLAEYLAPDIAKWLLKKLQNLFGE